jgi:hypothetical protein
MMAHRHPTRVISVLAKPKTGTPQRQRRRRVPGVDALRNLDLRRVWVPVFACGETGMTALNGMTAFDERAAA